MYIRVEFWMNIPVEARATGATVGWVFPYIDIYIFVFVEKYLINFLNTGKSISYFSCYVNFYPNIKFYFSDWLRYSSTIYLVLCLFSTDILATYSEIIDKNNS